MKTELLIDTNLFLANESYANMVKKFVQAEDMIKFKENQLIK